MHGKKYIAAIALFGLFIVAAYAALNRYAPKHADYLRTTLAWDGGNTKPAILRLQAQPVISSFSPNRGPTDIVIVIRGSALGNVTSVRFGSKTLVTPMSRSYTELRVKVPADAVTGKLILFSPKGKTVSNDTYTVAFDKPTTDEEAARFLAQATFGPTSSEITRLKQVGYATWIDDQLAKPATKMKPWMDSLDSPYDDDLLLYGWWRSALATDDQLRQRVAFALSEIFVISTENNAVRGYRNLGASDYYDVLIVGGLGSYRDLIEDVTLHPMMGVYLSHLGNKKEDSVTGVRPDENYAREVMQLFSIGLYELNIDGTPKLDASGAAIPSYAKADVEGLAKVFTGWGWGADNNYFWDASNTGFVFLETQSRPMRSRADFHSTSEKKFLGVTIPAQATPNPELSLKIALDRLANHPNTAPFIARQMIQRLVTSNPSPAYVARVATAFNNSSGNLGVMVRAILMDQEARSGSLVASPQYGKLREPLLRLTHLARAMNFKSETGRYLVGYRLRPYTTDAATELGQIPLGSPSVFNFFRPGYVPPNTSIADAGLVAPEMQIWQEVSSASWVTKIRNVIDHGFGGNTLDNPFKFDITSDYAAEIALAERPDELVNRLNLLLMSGQMSTLLRDDIREGINSIAIPSGNAQAIADAKRNRVQLALLLIMASPEYLIQK
jgi:uncharacterized protein (DUF1800 family)